MKKNWQSPTGHSAIAGKPGLAPKHSVPPSSCIYRSTPQRVSLGSLGVKLANMSEYHSPHNRRLLDAFVTQISLAMERVLLAQQAEQALVLQARESLERALLNSISHDLRTPLVSIIGALSSLRDENLQIR